MTFGERIRTYRIKMNMSQRQLAELINVIPQTISKWENDLSEPGFQMITKMTEIFHISHDELFVGETEILYKGPIYSAKKDLRMRKYYDFFVGFLVFLSVALIFTSSYVSTLENLTWHYPFGLSLMATFSLFELFVISRWRNIYLDLPDDLLDVYMDKVVIHSENYTIDVNNVQKIDILKYSFYTGLRLYDDNGYLKIWTTTNQTLVVRDIIDIDSLKIVLSKLKYKNIEEETK